MGGEGGGGKEGVLGSMQRLQAQRKGVCHAIARQSGISGPVFPEKTKKRACWESKKIH
jgi:hypothetical protein